MLRTTLLLLAAFFYTSPALAAWGENWGVMVWGAAAPSAIWHWGPSSGVAVSIGIAAALARRVPLRSAISNPS